MIGSRTPVPPRSVLPRGKVYALRYKPIDRVFGFKQDMLPKTVMVVFAREEDAYDVGYSIEDFVDKRNVLPCVSTLAKLRFTTSRTNLSTIELETFPDIETAIAYGRNSYLDILVCDRLQRKSAGNSFAFDGSIVIRIDDDLDTMRSVAERNFLASF